MSFAVLAMSMLVLESTYMQHMVGHLVFGECNQAVQHLRWLTNVGNSAKYPTVAMHGSLHQQKPLENAKGDDWIL